MYKFENIDAFYLLTLLIILTFIFLLFLHFQKKKFKILADYHLLSSLVKDYSKSKIFLKFILVTTSILLIVFSIANLQIGGKIEKQQRRETIDLILLLDISRSMLAEDIKPNRLERQKMFAMKLTENLDFANIGVVVFAGDAFIQIPITSDRSAVKMMINSATTDLIDSQGTAIGKALIVASEAFKRTKARNRAIVLLSDGENFEDDAIYASQIAQENNIVINTVYFGTSQGAPIPIRENNRLVGFWKDSNNETVITKPDISLMQELAQQNNGISVDGSAINSVDLVVDELSKLEKELGTTIQFKEYTSLFHLFAIPALLLLILDFLIFDKKMRWQYNLKKIMNYSFYKHKKNDI